MEVRLGYRPPLDVAALLAFFRTRAVGGLEVVPAEGPPELGRTLAIEAQGRLHAGWLRVRFDETQAQAVLQVGESLRGVLPQVIRRVRAAFDLDADPQSINAVLHSAFPRGDYLTVMVPFNPRRHPAQFARRCKATWDARESPARRTALLECATRLLDLRLDGRAPDAAHPRYATDQDARDRPGGGARPLNVFAYDGEDAAGSPAAPVGGLLGETIMSWLKVRFLAVREDARGRGVGRQLLAAAEREAIARGCKYAYLDTMSYQAGPFYEKLGYALCGRLADWDSHGHDNCST